ncbi:hypothetical protein ABZ312_03515 [Streptomyces sp. NPDC006207]
MTLSGRDAYRAELAALAVADDRVLCLEADLGGRGHPFQRAHHRGRFGAFGGDTATRPLAVAVCAAPWKGPLR